MTGQETMQAAFVVALSGLAMAAGSGLISGLCESVNREADEKQKAKNEGEQ